MVYLTWVQQRLRDHDFDPGPIDGIWGRKTMNAVIAFQRAKGLPQNGSLTNKTLAALREDPFSGAAPPSSDLPKRDVLDHFPWMSLALRKKGLHEKKDNVDLREFLKSDGKTLGDPSLKPWCGDFVETCIAVTLPTAVLPTNPYLARNWQSFGQVTAPCFGSILVFWRESLSGTKGHVGFYYSEDGNHYHVLGGNQSNRVSVAKLSKTRLLSAQMPTVGGPYPRKIVKSASDWEITTNEF